MYYGHGQDPDARTSSVTEILAPWPYTVAVPKADVQVPASSGDRQSSRIVCRGLSLAGPATIYSPVP